MHYFWNDHVGIYFPVGCNKLRKQLKGWRADTNFCVIGTASPTKTKDWIRCFAIMIIRSLGNSRSASNGTAPTPQWKIESPENRCFCWLKGYVCFVPIESNRIG